MGISKAAEIDAWLRHGGIVVAASERAARAAAGAYHRTRRAEGLKAWPAPSIRDWHRFIQDEWQARNRDERMVLSAFQEEAMWRKLLQSRTSPAIALRASSKRLAAMAMQAHSLLAAYLPDIPGPGKRAAWQRDAAEFSQWLTEFDNLCLQQGFLSSHLVARACVNLLRTDNRPRPPILLVGFDRVLPAQGAIFEAWGKCEPMRRTEATTQPQFYAAADAREEVAACANWAAAELAAAPDKRLLVIATDVATRRGQIERAFQDAFHAPIVEFSLGVPLGSVAIARGALLLLRWLTSALEEAELDWLIFAAVNSSAHETAALQALMRTVRGAGRERAHWTLDAFLLEAARVKAAPEWCACMRKARQTIEQNGGSLSPLDWSALAARTLAVAGWADYKTLVSAEFQAVESFERQLEICGSLGFDGRHIAWGDFLLELSDVVGETLFSPQSENSPVLVAGPSESAGLEADGIWFLGATEDSWPMRGNTHPFLPIGTQREALMPHSSAQLDWDLAGTISQRLVSAALQFTFSYPAQIDGVDARPSRLILELCGSPQGLPAAMARRPHPDPSTELVLDQVGVPLDLSGHGLRVDSSVITAQSQCPFKAFAASRLGARDWNPAQPSLSPQLRGKLLHAVLHGVWGGPPLGIRSLTELRKLLDLPAFVAPHASAAVDHVPTELRATMSARHLELEKERLTRLVCGWLEYERERADFEVQITEGRAEPTIAGLGLRLRLDRVDKLNDESLFVIDYKTGSVHPKAWDLPRADDLQLPLYASFGLEGGEAIGGLAFATIRAGETCFAGRLGDPGRTLGGVSNIGSLRKKPLDLDMLLAWRKEIETLARDFIAGEASVDPRDGDKTCERCGLQTLCRIRENESREGAEDSEEPA